MCCVEWVRKLRKSITKGVDPTRPGRLGSPRRAAPSAARETGVDRGSSSTKKESDRLFSPLETRSFTNHGPANGCWSCCKWFTGFALWIDLASSGPSKPDEEEKAKLCAACMKMRAVFRENLRVELNGQFDERFEKIGRIRFLRRV